MAQQRPKLAGPDEEIEDVEVIEGGIDAELEKMAAEFEAGDPNEYRAKIYRVLPDQGKRAYLYSVLPADFPIMDKVRDRYGSGTYECRLLKKNYIARRWTEIIEAPGDWEPPKAGEKERGDTHIMVSAIEKLGEMVFKMNEQSQARIAAVPVAPATPALDPIAMQQSMLTSMLQMRQLFAPDKAPANDNSRLAFDAFVEGVKIMKDVGGGNGGEKGIWDVLQVMAQPDGLLGRLTDMAQAADNRLTTPPQLVGPDGKPMLNVAGPPVAPAAPEAAQAPTVQQMQFILKMHLADLVASAKRGADPGLYAEVVIDKAGAQRAQEFVNGPEAIDKLVAINPEVANHVEWFRAVGVHINDMLTEAAPGDGGTDEPTTQGDDVAPIKTADGDAARDT